MSEQDDDDDDLEEEDEVVYDPGFDGKPFVLSSACIQILTCLDGEVGMPSLPWVSWTSHSDEAMLPRGPSHSTTHRVPDLWSLLAGGPRDAGMLGWFFFGFTSFILSNC